VEFIERRPVSLGSPLKGYEQSIHFQTLKQGKGGAVCADCHESHALRKPSDPRSAIYRTNIQRTCGRCHEKVRQVYEQSVHGKALAYGSTDSPTCVDCHGEHRIGEDGEHAPGSYAAYLSHTTCVRCHESERIVERYGLPAQRLTTYIDSYHGLADKSGSTVVANCASCHGIHDILPSKDPASSIHRDNLPRTCGKCHPGAGENFALGSIHVDADRGDRHGEDTGSVVIYYVRQFYLVLILATVLGMLGHNGLDLARNFAAPRLPRGGEYLRFSLSERVQHGTMALSFIVLAYSGFALKFPEAWWASPFTWAGAGEDWRRGVHRVAAVAMVGICLYHLGYLALSRRGREQFWEMLPRWQDARDAWRMLRCYLGQSREHPRFGRFGYIEKLEYWALVWGSLVMTFTGFLLWFENLALQFLPKWGLDVATAVHYYEAWLAVLAILVWHFYWVIFNPKVYPMSLVWLTGRLSKEAMAEEHPRELEELERREAP
jgi:formate dehydrogenase gamma subunit